MIGPTTSKQASGQSCVTAEDESCSHWCYSRRYCRRHNEAVHCYLSPHDSSAVTAAVLLLHCCSAANAASGTMRHRMPQLPQRTTCTWPVNAHKASTTTLQCLHQHCCGTTMQCGHTAPSLQTSHDPHMMPVQPRMRQEALALPGRAGRCRSAQGMSTCRNC